MKIIIRHIQQSLEDMINKHNGLNDNVFREETRELITKYLKELKTKQIVSDFYVTMNERNNTPHIVNNNDFRTEIFFILKNYPERHIYLKFGINI